MEQMNDIVKALRWLSKVRTYCDAHMVTCRECEFHGFCTDPDSDESIGQQAEWMEQAASAIEALTAAHNAANNEIDRLSQVVLMKDAEIGDRDRDNKKLTAENERLREALQYIADIAFDYDGYRDTRGLMSIIDELREHALNSIQPLPDTPQKAAEAKLKEAE